MGFFTSDLGEKEFAVSALAMAFSLWLVPAARRFMKFWLLSATTLRRAGVSRHQREPRRDRALRGMILFRRSPVPCWSGAVVSRRAR